MGGAGAVVDGTKSVGIFLMVHARSVTCIQPILVIGIENGQVIDRIQLPMEANQHLELIEPYCNSILIKRTREPFQFISVGPHLRHYDPFRKPDGFILS